MLMGPEEKYAQEAGTAPDKALPAKLICRVRAIKLVSPQDAGSVPFSLLPGKSSTWRLVQFAHEAGSSPTIIAFLTLNVVMCGAAAASLDGSCIPKSVYHGLDKYKMHEIA
jgi:hypothetical protein